MASKKKKPAEVLRLPGVAEDEPVYDGASAYRINPGDVDERLIGAVLAGRADLPALNRERFSALVRVLVALRVKHFKLPFDSYDGGTCSVIRKKLKTIRPSEMARAIIGASRHPYWSTKKPELAAILARAAVLQELADDKAPPPPRMKAVVVAEYVRVYPVAYELDWTARWPDLHDVEKHTVPIIEMHLTAMRKTITESKKLTDEEKAKVLS